MFLRFPNDRPGSSERLFNIAVLQVGIMSIIDTLRDSSTQAVHAEEVQ
jgi:hypothetical protein